jgi:predicted CXXCH cytochrome family protein
MKAAVVLFFFWSCCAAAQHGYVGHEVCAGCHKDIAATQTQTRMAQTWQGSSGKVLPAHYDQVHLEGPDPAIEYRVRGTVEGFGFLVHLPGRDAVDYVVEDLTGGTRHGVSFLFRVHDVGGIPLTRAPLIEGRYLYSAPLHNLALSPGFPAEKPASFETALGRVLSPGFEKKCLTCHGEPRHIGALSEVGVTCESCHGPGQSHLIALGKKTADKGILNPKKLPVAEQMRPCSQCHAGFSTIQDPMPDDVLISDQVTALQNSECWRQTQGQLTCTNCHNPHADAPREALQATSEKTCLTCHSAGVVQHAALCPVNRTSGCVACHMPDVKDRPPFEISDHWIRVHPEQNVPVPKQIPEWRSQRTPERLFLRIIALDEAGKAADIKEKLSDGASFFDLARANSLDRDSALNGGFLGDAVVGQLDPTWSSAAVRLQPGEISGVIDAHGKYFIVQRMPRNFREEAEIHFNKAIEARKAGDRQQTSAELLEALKIYPRFLRALTYLGVIYGEAGNPQTGVGILSVATRIYPEDAGAHFNLGIAYGATGNADETSEYKRALAIDPDLVPAYLNLGAALYNRGQYDDAIQIYRQGLEVNPLIASLHYSLSVALQHQGKAKDAEAEMALALKIDPKAADR